MPQPGLQKSVTASTKHRHLCPVHKFVSISTNPSKRVFHVDYCISSWIEAAKQPLYTTAPLSMHALLPLSVILLAALVMSCLTRLHLSELQLLLQTHLTHLVLTAKNQSACSCPDPPHRWLFSISGLLRQPNVHDGFHLCSVCIQMPNRAAQNPVTGLCVQACKRCLSVQVCVACTAYARPEPGTGQ